MQFNGKFFWRISQLIDMLFNILDMHNSDFSQVIQRLRTFSSIIRYVFIAFYGIVVILNSLSS